jgi:hypothetical protein
MGVLLVTALFGYGIALATKLRKRPAADVDVLAALLVVGIPTASLVGVVMESPFGAIPYFWALGQLGSVEGSVGGAGAAKGASMAPVSTSGRS